MRLYGEPVSLFSVRVLLAVRAKGLDLPLTPLPGGGPRSAEFHALNPVGKMPVLEDGGVHLAESQVICEYLEETQPGKPLLPADAMERARCRLLARIVDLYVMPPATAFYRNLKPEQRDPAAIPAAHAELRTALGYFQHYMGAGPYAMGPALTLADCALAPLLDALEGTILPVFDLELPLAGLPRLTAWWRHIGEDAVCGPVLRQYRSEFRAFMR